MTYAEREVKIRTRLQSVGEGQDAERLAVLFGHQQSAGKVSEQEKTTSQLVFNLYFSRA
jgi:hypothetical protein